MYRDDGEQLHREINIAKRYYKELYLGVLIYHHGAK